MTKARVMVVGSAVFATVLLTDLAYCLGVRDTRKKLDVDSVDLPVDENTPDSDIAPESDNDKRE